METICVRINDYPSEIANLLVQAKTRAGQIWVTDLEKLYTFWDTSKACKGASIINLSKN